MEFAKQTNLRCVINNLECSNNLHYPGRHRQTHSDMIGSIVPHVLLYCELPPFQRCSTMSSIIIIKTKLIWDTQHRPPGPAHFWADEPGCRPNYQPTGLAWNIQSESLMRQAPPLVAVPACRKKLLWKKLKKR